MTELDKRGLRRWVFFAIAVVLVLLGHWLQSQVSLEALEGFAWGIVSDLGQIQPFALIPDFLQRLGGCSATYGCDWALLLNPLHYPVVAFDTLSDLLTRSSDLAGAVFVLALVVGGITLLELWKRYVKGRGAEWNLGDIAILAAILPLVVSVTALVLQLVAMALFWLFGAVIGLILFLLGTFGWVLSAIAFVRDVHGKAETLTDLIEDAVDADAPARPDDTKP